jgi:hypothetical protein
MKYYKAGIISLVLIPMLLIPYVNKEFHKRDLRVMKFNTPAPNYKESPPNYNFKALNDLRQETTLSR